MHPNDTRVAAPLHIGLLGPTHVVDPSTGAALRASAVRTLLAHLAAVEGARSPESIAMVLWPGRTPAGPVAAVRNIAWRARKLGGPDLILTDVDGKYRLDPRRCELDVTRFRELLTQAQTLQGVDRPEEALAALDSAVELWRGPALAEWAGDPWAAPLIGEWTELLIGAREERASLRFEIGDHEQAESELTELCASNPDREHAWAVLITNLDNCGRPGDARQAYDHVRQHLAASGLEPGAELQAAIERLARPSRSVGPQPVELGAYRLIGRDKDAAALTAMISDAITTPCSKLILVEGEAGIGKTLLTRAVVAGLQTDHRVLAWFTACDAQLNLPYAPLVSLVHAIGSAAALDTTWLQGHGEGELSHWQVRDRFTSLLERAAERVEAQVVVLVVDDIRWAPRLTLDVVGHLLGRVPTVPIVVIGTYRTHGERSGDADLDELERRVWSEHLELGGLSRDDSVQLYLQVGGNAARAEEVWQLTGGNPFYLQELGRGDPSFAGVGELVTPNAVLQRALAARIGELPVADRQLLALAAAIGTRFDEVLLGAAAVDAARAGVDVDPGGVVDAVLTGLRAGLVVPADGGPAQWGFRHDLVRQNLYLSTSGRERAQAHLAVARAMQQMGVHRPPEVAQVAHHLRAAWPLTTADEAAQHLLAAAETPVALLDPHTSARLCARGLDVLALDPASPTRLTHRLLVARGTALTDALEPDPARKSLLAAIQAIDPAGADAHLFAEAVATYAETWLDRTLPDPVAELLVTVAQADRLGLSAARCRCLAMLHAVDTKLALTLAARLAEQARTAGDVDGERRLLTAIWRWQRPVARRQSAQLLADLAAACGTASIADDAAVRQAITAAQLGTALVIPTAAYRGHEARTPGEALSAVWAITVHTATGDFDQARDGIVAAAPHVAELAAVIDLRPARLATILLRQCLQLAAFTGRQSDTELLAGPVNLAEIPFDLDSGAINTLIRGRRGDIAGARQACAALAEQGEPVLMPDRVAEYASIARACIETGYDRGLAPTIVKLADAADGHVVRGEHLYLGPVRHRLAQWTQREGRLTEAAREFGHAAEQCAAIGARPWEVRARLAQADALRTAGQDGAAVATDDRAEALAAEIGMSTRHEVGEFMPREALTARRPHATA